MGKKRNFVATKSKLSKSLLSDIYNMHIIMIMFITKLSNCGKLLKLFWYRGYLKRLAQQVGINNHWMVKTQEIIIIIIIIMDNPQPIPKTLNTHTHTQECVCVCY